VRRRRRGVDVSLKIGADGLELRVVRHVQPPGPVGIDRHLQPRGSDAGPRLRLLRRRGLLHRRRLAKDGGGGEKCGDGERERGAKPGRTNRTNMVPSSGS